jgi:HD-like signal output (HDOD) protein
MQLSELVSQRFVMPSIPKVMALLLTEMMRGEPDLRRIDQLLSTDPALTTLVLQAANASFSKLSGQLHSVAEALAVLRLTQVQSLVAAAAASATFKSVPGIALPQFWAYCLDTAKVARSLAALLHQNQQAAFTCGLMHAVGELAMRMAMPEVMALDSSAAVFDLKRARVERHSVGFCYTEVSAAMARHWHFPDIMVNALAYQHAPFDNEVYEPLAGVIHLAIWRARAKQAALSAKALAVSFPARVGDVLGLDIDMVLQQDPIDWSAQTVVQTL